jgi:GT2 family glycosyltransferase
VTSAPIRLSIILVNFNGGELLRNCLRSIAAHGGGIAREVILFDNGSTDGSPETATGDLPDIRVIRSAENLGFSAANNAAAKTAAGEYLLFLNTDTVLNGNSLAPMMGWLDEHPDAGAIGPKLLFADGQFQFSSGRLPGVGVEFQQMIMHTLTRKSRKFFTPLFRPLFSGVRATGWVTGACLMVRSAVFREVGGFDEEMFMYFEDKDLCKRIADAGWKVVYVPVASVVHVLAGSSRNVGNSRIEEIYRSSQRRYYRKHHGWLQNSLLNAYLKFSGKP